MPQKDSSDFLSDATPQQDFLSDATRVQAAPAPSSGYFRVAGPRTPSGQPMKPLPELPRDLTGMVAGIPEFGRQAGAAAKKDASDALSAIKKKASDAWDILKADPSAIVPMWFSALTGVMETGAKTVTAPVESLLEGNVSDAVSQAAGGDPEAARRYAAEGNEGGEFWEMMGKPLLMLAAGEAVSRSGVMGKALAPRAEDAAVSRLRVVRGMMADSGLQKRGIDLFTADQQSAQLAQQALQDAAREIYGTGRAGEKALAKAAPRFGNLSVDQGNQAVARLTNKAVELAGVPADVVNSHFGYLPGHSVARDIQVDLFNKAAMAQQDGLNTYAHALMERANALSGAQTLGDIYRLKVGANRLADMPRNTAEAIDAMDSYAALASSVRSRLYPEYQRLSGVDLTAAGRKEGSIIAVRNGVEKRWAQAQARTDALHTPGGTMKSLESGWGARHTALRYAAQKAQQAGFLNPQGELNATARKAVGRLSPETVPESVSISRPAEFSPAPPARLALPGPTRSTSSTVATRAGDVTVGSAPGAMKFEIPGNLPEFGREGKMAQSAAQRPGHAFESPSFLTSSAPTRTASFAPNGRIIAGPEGSMGADISTARVPEAQTDVAKGPGTLITGDVNVARNTVKRLEGLIKSERFSGLPRAEQQRIISSYTKLSAQVDAYDAAARGGATVSHTAPQATVTPRKTGTLPAPLARRAANVLRRKGLPAEASSYGRQSDQHPTDAWQQGQPQQ